MNTVYKIININNAESTMGNKVKIKTNRGAAKPGKVRFRRANRAHINTKRSTKQVRQGRANGVMKDCDAKLVHRMLPYS
jgi:large subunit ribosomal protein L35